MKNILKSTLILLCGLALFTACSDDRDSNPTLAKPTEFVLNEPALKDVTVDLANSESIILTCSQPNYGFPVKTHYIVEVSNKQDMSNAETLSTTFTSAKMTLSAAEIARKLTAIEVKEGKTEADFPMDLAVYLRVRAYVPNTTGDAVKNTTITSNVVALNKVHLLFSLPPVTVPEHLYLAGGFCGKDWNKSVEMVQVHSNTHIFWHMVYIDGTGVKFNSTKEWNGEEVGFENITVNTNSELGGDIKNVDGFIASSKPGWYLMIVTTSVEGRTIKYDVTFNKPEVRFIGTLIGAWTEGQGEPFTVPATADGDFVSPEMIATAGTDADGCIRMYVKIPDNDWWHSEFIVGIDGDKISYRGNGKDQQRVGNSAGQRVYLNFSTDKGKIE